MPLDTFFQLFEMGPVDWLQGAISPPILLQGPPCKAPHVGGVLTPLRVSISSETLVVRDVEGALAENKRSSASPLTRRQRRLCTWQVQSRSSGMVVLFSRWASQVMQSRHSFPTEASRSTVPS